MTRSHTISTYLGLVDALGRFFGAGTSVIEFGAGKGCWTDALLARSVRVRAYEGAKNIEPLTRGLVQHADLTRRLDLGAPAEWVLCLEVAEHVPREFERTLLGNLDRHNTKGVVLSWSDSVAGSGHINPKYTKLVGLIMRDMNYTEDVKWTNELQHAADFAWFKVRKVRSVLGGGVRVWRRGGSKRNHHGEHGAHGGKESPMALAAKQLTTTWSLHEIAPDTAAKC